MSKRLSLNQITLCADGSIGLQWLKQVIDPDSGEVLFSEPHRTVVEFDGDVKSQIDAAIDHLEGMGYRADRAEKARHVALVKKVDGVGKGDDAINAVRAEKIARRAAQVAAEEEAARAAEASGG